MLEKFLLLVYYFSTQEINWNFFNLLKYLIKIENQNRRLTFFLFSSQSRAIIRRAIYNTNQYPENRSIEVWNYGCKRVQTSYPLNVNRIHHHHLASLCFYCFLIFFTFTLHLSSKSLPSPTIIYLID